MRLEGGWARATASNSEKLSEVFWIHRRLKHSLLHRVLVFLSLNDPQGQLPQDV